ncbi:MAG: endo-1,4-beta-xylanase [Lachnospiraceae bacterium]|nr:endo-1,4-beta-xylanase [Lachnospiraceae bacterium]
MSRKTRTITALCLILCMLFTGCKKDKNKATEQPTETPTPTVELSPTPTPEPESEVEHMTLKDRYKDVFKVGVALNNTTLKNKDYMDIVKEQFNSFTFENEMKPDSLLNKSATQKGYPDTNTEPVLQFISIQNGLSIAQQNGFGVRGHTLCWYSQTPRWFFTVDYSDSGELCDRETMIARLESYIKQVMEFCQTEYPGVVYAWDVVNEAVDPGSGDANGIRREKNNWYATIGPDFIDYAFAFARKYSDGTAKLYYNDYNCYDKMSTIIKALKSVQEAGNIDGIGMQCHFGTMDSMRDRAYKAAKYFTSNGYCVQITELDIGSKTRAEGIEKLQAIRYKELFYYVEQGVKAGEINLDSITVWGLYDDASWRTGENPLLYKRAVGKLEKKPAWYGAMQDPAIEIPQN